MHNPYNNKEHLDAMPRSYLRRLNRETYRGETFIHWSMTIENRATGWLTPAFHIACREVLTHTLFRYQLACPVYCLLPDHLHLLWAGYASNSDQLHAVAFFRKHMNRLLAPRCLQQQGYDHILRADEREEGTFEKAAAYVIENPVRASLIREALQYPFTGCVVPGYPELTLDLPDYWKRFWRGYYYLRTRARGQSPA